MTREGFVPLEQIPRLPEPVRQDVQRYVQVYDVLYALICSGDAPPGALIPGENALAAHFGVSRGTVRQAVRYLEEDGLIIKHQGRVTQVADRSNRENRGLQNFSDVCRNFCTVPITHVGVRWRYTGTGQWMSEQMQLSRGTLMILADLMYYSREEVVAHSQRLIPSVWLERCSVDPDNAGEMHAFLLDTVPQLVARTKTEIMILSKGVTEISRSDEIPCFSVSEITYDVQDRPVAHFKNYLRSDCCRLYITRRQGPR